MKISLALWDEHDEKSTCPTSVLPLKYERASGFFEAWVLLLSDLNSGSLLYQKKNNLDIFSSNISHTWRSIMVYWAILGTW